MTSDGRIDSRFSAVLVPKDLVQALAHAMEALELELRRVGAELPGEMQHRGHGVRVVRCELRVNAVALLEELARIGDIADVGCRLLDENRKAIEAKDLGALDLGVPVGALDQSDHDP